MQRRRAAVLPVLLVASAGLAQTQWNNAAGGQWNNPVNWTPNNVPDSPGESALIAIPGSYRVTLQGIHPDIDWLLLSNGQAAVDIAGGYGMRINAGLTNSGLIVVNANHSGSDAYLVFDATGTLDGPGRLLLDGPGADAKLQSAGGVTITHASGHTIGGRGIIDAALVNEGTISADYDGGEMQLHSGAKTNNSLMQATNGGTLAFLGQPLTQGPAGIVRADGGVVRFASGSESWITGGRLESINGGVLVREPWTTFLTDVTLEGELQVWGGGVIAVAGSGITNDGLLIVNANHSGTDAALRFDASGALAGSGIVDLANPSADAQLTSGAGVTITNGPEQTILGRGLILAQLVNEGLVSADYSAGEMQLHAGAKVNKNLMQAINGGTLAFYSQSLTQDPGAIVRADGGVVRFASGNDSSITGGRLESSNGGVLVREPWTTRLTDVALAGELRIDGGGVIAVAGSGIINDGRLIVDANHSGTDAALRFDADGVLAGSGLVELANPSADAQLATAAGVTLIHGPLHAIVGRGIILAQMINEGTISADYSGGEMQLHAGAKINNNLMRATNGGTLVFYTQDLAQGPAGRLVADGGDVLFRAGYDSSITGGRLESGNGGAFVREPWTTWLRDVTLDGELRITGGGAVAVTGSGLENNGVVVVNSNHSGSDAFVRFEEPGTLSGNGMLYLDGPGGDAQLTYAAGATITNGPDHTIAGRGVIYAPLINEGLVSADYPGGVMALYAEPKTNNALMLATGGGTLEFLTVAVAQGDNGIIRADDGVVRFQAGYNSSIVGGRLETTGGGVLVREPWTTSLADVTLDGELRINGGGVIAVGGNGIINDGLIVVNANDSGADAFLSCSRDGALLGHGQILLDGPDADAQLHAGGFTVHIGPQQRASGIGRITGGVFELDGILSPGSPVGTMYAYGATLRYGPTARYEIEINGTGSGQYDRLVGNAAHELGGALYVNTAESYVPAFGHTFEIVAGSSIAGRFDTVTAPDLGDLLWRVRYDATKAVLLVTCVADFNLDVTIDTRDVLAFLNAWAIGDAEADIDENGTVDTRDVLAFLNEWTRGC